MNRDAASRLAGVVVETVHVKNLGGEGNTSR